MQNKRNHEGKLTGTLSRRQFLVTCASGAAALGLAPTVLAAAMGTGPSPAVNANARYCRFSRLTICDYGPFRGLNEIAFTPRQNVILGANGTGKTTLFEALASPGSPPARRTHPGIPNPQMSVDVQTHGNPDLLRRYRDLIFLDDRWCYDARRDSSGWLNSAVADRLADDAKDIFLQFVPYRESVLKSRSMKDVLVRGWGLGETQLAALSYAFAARNRLGLDLPLVMDQPFTMFDDQHRAHLSRYVQQLPSQVILFVSESELWGQDQLRPQWHLAYGRDRSRILRHADPEVPGSPA